MAYTNMLRRISIRLAALLRVVAGIASARDGRFAGSDTSNVKHSAQWIPPEMAYTFLAA
jgi:hypothetical protein